MRIPETDRAGAHEFELAGAALLADPTGALVWPLQRTLVVADLHLEKASSLAARRGLLLPPYDTAATLAKLADAILRNDVRRVVALGDSFHDPNGPARMPAEAGAALRALMRGRDWIWLRGNHDPEPLDMEGDSCAEFTLGPLVFRHAPRDPGSGAEVAGHLHPAARLVWSGRAIRRRCFAIGRCRLVLPAFGALAGGLNVLDQAFSPLFAGRPGVALLGGRRVYPVSPALLIGD
jgi:DNA ligase-associated metallophosphoesterase